MLKFIFPTCTLQPRLKVTDTGKKKLDLEIFEITGSDFP